MNTIENRYMMKYFISMIYGLCHCQVFISMSSCTKAVDLIYFDTDPFLFYCEYFRDISKDSDIDICWSTSYIWSMVYVTARYLPLCHRVPKLWIQIILIRIRFSSILLCFFPNMGHYFLYTQYDLFVPFDALRCLWTVCPCFLFHWLAYC